MTSSLTASFEAIAFQINSKLLPSLVECFQKIIDSKADLTVLEREHNIISELTFSATGIRMNYSIQKGGGYETPYLVEVEMFNVNALNVLNPDMIKKLRGYDLDNLDIYDAVNGSIDLKNGRVSGVFSTIPNTFKANFANYNGYFTAEELAALYLHEVGHAWAMYFYMGETLVTNTILAEIVGRIDLEETVEKKFLLGKAAVKLSKAQLNADVANMNTAEIAAVVLEGQINRMQQRTGSRWYDIRLAEALADQFAARWMTGAALVSALAKSERAKNVMFSTTGFDPIWVGLASNILTFAFWPFTQVQVAGVAKYVLERSAMSVLQKVARTFATSVVFSAVGYVTSTHKRYDNPRQRFGAIRRELVTLLKSRELTPDIRKQALADIEIIDNELSKIHNFGDIMGKLAKYTFGLVIGRKQALDHTHNTEELANNRFYELSALFKDTAP